MVDTTSGALCASAYADLIRGAYPEEGEYKIALYSKSSDLRGTSSYSTEGEWVGAGYEAGGATLTGWKLEEKGEKVTLTFSDVEWLNADIVVRSALIYRASDNKAIRVINFGRDVGVLGGVFTIFLSHGAVIELGPEMIDE